MQPAYIKAELEMAGVRAARVAERLGVSRETVSKVILGKARSQRVAAEISRVTGISVDVLFPGQYQRPARRRRRVTKRKAA